MNNKKQILKLEYGTSESDVNCFYRDVVILDLELPIVEKLSQLPLFPNLSVHDEYALGESERQEIDSALDNIDSVMRIGPVVSVLKVNRKGGKDYSICNFTGLVPREVDKNPNCLILPMGETRMELEVLTSPVTKWFSTKYQTITQWENGIPAGHNSIGLLDRETIDFLKPQTLKLNPNQALLFPDSLLLHRWLCESETLEIRGYFKAL